MDGTSDRTVVIDPGNYRHIYVYGVPRGATNLFCALMHNHNNIAAVNHQSTKRYTDALVQKGKSGMAPVVFGQSDLIYEQGGMAKDFGVVSHLVFDKVHWGFDRAFRNILTTYDRVEGGVADGIVLIRHPFKSLMSMDAFHKNFGRPMWALTRKNVALFLVRYFLPQLWLLKNEKNHGIVIERFVENVRESYADLCGKLNLPFEKRFCDFGETFRSANTWTGGHFVLQQREVPGGGTFLTARGITATKQQVYCDGLTGEPTWGYGQFNAAMPLDPGRLQYCRDQLNTSSQKIIRDVFENGMAKNDVDYLFETDILDVKRLRGFQIRGIWGYIFRWLMNLPPPEWIFHGWRWLRLRRT